MRNSMMIARAFVVAALMLALGVPCAATYYAAPQYLLGQPVPRLAVTLNGSPIYSVDQNNPVRVPSNQNLQFGLYYSNGGGGLGNQVTDIDSIGDPNEFNDMLRSWFDYDGDGNVDDTHESTYVYGGNTYTTTGAKQVHWKLKDLGRYFFGYGYIDTGADDYPRSDAPDPTNWDAEGELYLYVYPGDTTAPDVLVVDDGCSTQSTTTLHASWTACDPESEIVSYEYAIGTTPYGANVVSWTTPSPATATEVTRTNLSLTRGQTYYFTVRATNGVYLPGMGCSDGIRVAEAQVTTDL